MADLTAVADVADVAIPFSKFIPIIKDVSEVFSTVTNLYGSAQHNKAITKKLVERISTANTTVNLLKSRDDFLTSVYYMNLQRLVQVLQNMKKFVEEITQLSTMQKKWNSSTIKSTFKELCAEYDSSISSLNFSMITDRQIKDEDDKNFLREDMHQLLLSQESLVESIDDIRLKLTEKQKERSNELKNFDLSKQSKQIKENLNKKEQEITDLEILIEYKQNKINTNKEEIKKPFIDEGERTKLENQIIDLKNQVINLQNQLTEKGKELINLKKENNELIEQCFFYLTLIKSFRDKKEEIEELKEELIKKVPTKEKLGHLCQLQEEFSLLETELEEFVINQKLNQEDFTKKRYWNDKQVLVDKEVIKNQNKVIVELSGNELSEKKDELTYLEEETQKIINESNKNTVKRVLLVSRTEKDKSEFTSIYSHSESKEKEIIEKTIIFLTNKEIFMNNRQKTVNKLQSCHDKLKSFIENYEIGNKTLGAVSSTLGLIPIGGGVTSKLLEGVCSVGISVFRKKYLEKNSKNFRQYLANDKEVMSNWFKKSYQSLINDINWNNQPISSAVIDILKLDKYQSNTSFDDKYNIYTVVNNNNVSLKCKSILEIKEMETSINLSGNNLKQIRAELEVEKISFLSN